MSAALTHRVLEKFHNAAKSAGLDYLLIGGFAASFWGKPRFTADVDFVVEESTFDQFKKLLSSIGYKLDYLHPKRSFAHFCQIDVSNFRIDLMIVNAETWIKLKASSSQAKFSESETYPVVDALHLIAMKLHAAKQSDRQEFHKDINDIVEVMLAQKITFADLEQADIINKHGSEKTTALLRDMLQARKAS
jgi:Nucleotidyl transferase AbiEii toxin, Type IV TA system